MILLALFLIGPASLSANWWKVNDTFDSLISTLTLTLTLYITGPMDLDPDLDPDSILPSLLVFIRDDNTFLPLCFSGEMQKLLRLQEELDKKVIGQQTATQVVAEAIQRSRAGLSDPTKPIATLAFLGRFVLSSCPYRALTVLSPYSPPYFPPPFPDESWISPSYDCLWTEFLHFIIYLFLPTIVCSSIISSFSFIIFILSVVFCSFLDRSYGGRQNRTMQNLSPVLIR